MRRGPASVVAAITIAALAIVAPAAGAAGLELLDSKQLDPRLTELTFRTPALAQPTQVRVLLPDGYRASGHSRYPVLYLLHGAFDDYTSWTAKGDVERATAGLPLIVVMPDGGAVGNYVNWYNHGSFGQPEWETYHVGQLLPWIDTHYRTIGRRAGRAIAGLSMGAGGAMKYAAAHPDLFVAALSFSGAVDLNNPAQAQLTEASGALDGDRLPGAIYGLRATDEVRWRNNSPTDLAENLGGLKLWLLTGNGQAGGPRGNGFDPIEYVVHQEGLVMHEGLTALAIPHVWDDYGPGGHQWYYWQRDLVQTLPGLMDVFAQPPGPPSPFSYTRAYPDFSAYGWRVQIDRPAVEFSELRDAGPGGFTLRGSGTGTVTTARDFCPHSLVRATIASHAGTATEMLHASRDGRLTVTVPLGPGNPFQQYTAQARAWAQALALTGGVPPGTEVVGGSIVYTTRVALTGSPAAASMLKSRHGRRYRRHDLRRRQRRPTDRHRRHGRGSCRQRP